MRDAFVERVAFGSGTASARTQAFPTNEVCEFMLLVFMFKSFEGSMVRACMHWRMHSHNLRNRESWPADHTVKSCL